MTRTIATAVVNAIRTVRSDSERNSFADSVRGIPSLGGILMGLEAPVTTAVLSSSCRWLTPVSLLHA